MRGSPHEHIVFTLKDVKMAYLMGLIFATIPFNFPNRDYIKLCHLKNAHYEN